MHKYFSQIIILIFLLQHISLNAQTENDSLVLSYQTFLENIVLYHPLAQKSNLELEYANANLLMSKGALDPILSSSWDQKNFSDDLYYRQYNTTFDFPTPLGINIVAGYENTDGVFLNPENKTDNYGLWHLGLEVDVLQGLIVNERRTAIQQAKLIQNLSQNERDIQLNDLIYNATIAYFIWQFDYFFQDVYNENVVISERNFENTRQSFFSGEKTTMDTLEAYISYKESIINLKKNETSLIKSKLSLESFLWFNELPISIQEWKRPENYKDKILGEISEYALPGLESHPEILLSKNKISSLEIEQRLKREKLKPKLKVKYNPLLETSENNVAPNFSINDFKWGFDFAFPLILRSERGNIQKTEIKLEQEKLKLTDKSNKLRNKIEASWLQQFPLQEQIVLLNNNVESYKRLLEGENTKFNAGESSVFLLNKRQEKYIESQLKLISAYYKLQIESLNLLYYTNQILSLNN